MKNSLKENKPNPELVRVNCGLCGSEENRVVRCVRGFRIVQCSRCGCIYTNPREVWKYTQSSTLLDEKLSVYQREYWPKRKASADRFWEGAGRYREYGSLLEVGCGFGFFLNEARLHGWSVTGVEISPDEVGWGREQFGLNIVPTLEDELLAGQQFDIIVLWDVIEHIPDVIPLLKCCFNLLRPGGAFILKTPNADGLILQPNWWLWAYLPLYWQLIYPANPLEHVYHFTPVVMKKILQENGFTVRSLETWQDWDERIIVGHNRLIILLREALMRVAWKTRLPYEMTILSEKPL